VSGIKNLVAHEDLILWQAFYQWGAVLDADLALSVIGLGDEESPEDSLNKEGVRLFVKVLFQVQIRQLPS